MSGKNRSKAKGHQVCLSNHPVLPDGPTPQGGAKEAREDMAQATTNQGWPDRLKNGAFTLSRDPQTHLIGLDGFPWIDHGLIGEAHHRLDWILRAHVSDTTDAQAQVESTLSWLLNLAPSDRLMAGIAWLSRWHWLWNLGALEPNIDGADPRAYLAHFIAEDMSTLLQASLRPGSTAQQRPELVEQLVLWSASPLFDRSDVLPRSIAVQHAHKAVFAGQATPALIGSLKVLLEAENRPASQAHREPESQSRAIHALLSRLESTVLEAEDHDVNEANQLALMLLDPHTWTRKRVADHIIDQLCRLGLLDELETEVALATARAAILATDPSEANAEARSILDAITRIPRRQNY